MGSRPNYINLPQRPSEVARTLGLPSPRLQHYDGDIPPSLSPLDMFAAQSRALAKQLDDETRQGRRVSRLPPATVKKSLSIPRSDRPDFMRSTSTGNLSIAEAREEDVRRHVVEEPRWRPVSEYPRLSGVDVDIESSPEERDDFETPMERFTGSQAPHQLLHQADYFGLNRVESPEPSISAVHLGRRQGPPAQEESTRSEPFPPMPVKKTSADSSTHSLAPSSFPRHHRLHQESSDDDYTSSNAGSTFSDNRKLSTSSGISAPHSPMSPFVYPHPRSPSLQSEVSVGGTRLPRPAFNNFSRPLSSASLHPPTGSPARSSTDLQRDSLRFGEFERPIAPYMTEDTRSVSSDGYLSGTDTYTHSKFSLPRGRTMSRNSVVFGGLSTPHFEWSEPLFQSKQAPTSSGQPSSHNQFSFDFDHPKQQSQAAQASQARPTTPENRLETKPLPASPAESFHSAKSSRPSVERGDLRAIRGRPPLQIHEDDTSSRSNSTIRAASYRTGTSNHSYMSPEDHVTKAIESHERGSLKESTYHLRVAAMQSHPTAMLLYALACRHGWGMRANQREGVDWLKKAVECVGHEVAEIPAQTPGGSQMIQNQKARRAQFALGIYELGVSHLNGWGCEQDRALALRCFEIAGNWGDPDALAEAGYCYAEGIGCKKDLKKAARYYRMAEAKGMSMVGNSW